MHKWLAVAAVFLGWVACTVPNDDPFIAADVPGTGGGGVVDAAASAAKKDAGASSRGGVTGAGGSSVIQSIDAAALPDVSLPNTGGIEVPSSNEVPVVNTGGTSPLMNTGGTPPPPLPPPLPLPPPPIDTARFNFESGAQDWVDLGVGNTREPGSAPVVSSERAFLGSKSLKYSVIVMDSNRHERIFGVVGSKIGELPAGRTISFQVWVPTGHKIETLSAFVQTRIGGSWKSDDRKPSQFTANAWTQMNIPIPQSYAGQEPLELGVRLVFNGPWTGEVYVDSVNVQ
jgi:hypothetical protein